MYIIELYLAVGIVLWWLKYAKDVNVATQKLCDQYNIDPDSGDARFGSWFADVAAIFMWPIILVADVYDFMYNLVLRISLFFED